MLEYKFYLCKNYNNNTENVNAIDSYVTFSNKTNRPLLRTVVLSSNIIALGITTRAVV